MNNTNRYVWIDSLKGIAILGIILVHSGIRFESGVVTRFALILDNSVQMFFIISAYLTWKSLDRYFEKNEFNLKTICNWYKLKFVKLAPLYYLALVAYLIANPTIGVAYETNQHISVGNMIAHLLMLHGLFPTYADAIMGVEWYIGVLIVFYLIAPFVHKVVNTKGKAVALFAGTVVFTAVATRGANALLGIRMADFWINSYFSQFWFVLQLPTLALGVLFYFLEQETDSGDRCIQSLLVIVFATMFLWGQVGGSNNLLGFNTFTLVAVGYMFFAYGVIIWKNPVVCNNVFALLGKYSYPIYLLHTIVISLTRYIIPLSSSVQLQVIKYIVDVAICFVIAIILTKYVDDPIQRFLKKHVR